jgi:hypothetical protein
LLLLVPFQLDRLLKLKSLEASHPNWQKSDGGIMTGDPWEKDMLSNAKRSRPAIFGQIQVQGTVCMDAFNSHLQNFNTMKHCSQHGMEKHWLACMAVMVTGRYYNGALLFNVM